MDIETTRAEALRKLGRNIVNFAKIEAGFKHLLAISQSEGTPQEILEQWHTNQTKLHKQPLGTVVQTFYQNVLADASQADPQMNFSGPGMFFSFKVGCSDPDALKVYKRALSTIVAERNKLIHHDLAQLDTTSIEDYRQLISLLDEQNPRLLAHLEELKWMIESVGESWKELLQRLPSDLDDA